MTRDLMILAGCVAIIAGFLLLHEAFEAQSKPRPFWLHFLPGL